MLVFGRKTPDGIGETIIDILRIVFIGVSGRDRFWKLASLRMQGM